MSMKKGKIFVIMLKYLLLYFSLFLLSEAAYEHIGCYKDKRSRAISGGFVWFSKDVIKSCYGQALSLGYRYFAVQYGKECFTSSDAGSTYYKYGTVSGCNNGRGGHWKMDVYRIKAQMGSNWLQGSLYSFEHIGCYKDKRSRAISGGFVEFSKDVVIKCYGQALSLGYRYFAVQYGKECYTSSDAGSTYYKYGTVSGCNNGRGGHWKMDVYRIKDSAYSVEHIGCYKDKHSRAISGGLVTFPKDVVFNFCYGRAITFGYRYFAVQYGNECFTSSDAGSTYYKYGTVSGCKNGRGGDWKMDVYRIKDPPMDGSWSSWSTFTICLKSKSSLSGIKARKRLCNNPAPKLYGSYCAGTAIQTSTCGMEIGAAIRQGAMPFVPGKTLKEAVEIMKRLLGEAETKLYVIKISIGQLHKDVMANEDGVNKVSAIKRDYRQTRDLLDVTAKSMETAIQKSTGKLLTQKKEEKARVTEDISTFDSFLKRLDELIKESETERKRLIDEKTSLSKMSGELNTLISDYKLDTSSNDDNFDLEPEMAKELRDIINKKTEAGYYQLLSIN